MHSENSDFIGCEDVSSDDCQTRASESDSQVNPLKLVVIDIGLPSLMFTLLVNKMKQQRRRDSLHFHSNNKYTSGKQQSHIHFVLLSSTL